MAEREHFTNGRCFAGGSGVALVTAAFGAQIAGWGHWISIGTAYGSGGILILLSSVWITKSYYSRDASLTTQPKPVVDERSLAETERHDLITATTSDLLPNVAMGLFSPLQLEMFQLAKDLAALEKIGPSIPPERTRPQLYVEARARLAASPEYREALARNGGDLIEMEYEEIAKIEQERESALRSDRNLRTTSEYAITYAPRIKQLMLELGKEGVNALGLQHFTVSIPSIESIPHLRARLLCLAHQLDGVQLRERQPGEN